MKITAAMQSTESRRHCSGRLLFYTALAISATTVVQASISDLHPQSLGEQAGASADNAATRETYGVPLVSGFYGKGIWSAWILTVISTLIDKFLVPEKDTPEKTAHLWGIDLNLVGAFAYPVIAAVDILAHMNRYFTNEEISTKDIALLDAPVVVVREGMVIGAILLFACSFATRTSNHRCPGLAVLFSTFLWAFIIIVNKIVELGYCRFGWPSYLNTLVIMPYRFRFDRPQSALAPIYLRFAQIFRSTGSEFPGLPFWSVGIFTDPPLWVEIPIKVCVLLFPSATLPRSELEKMMKRRLGLGWRSVLEHFSLGITIGRPQVNEADNVADDEANSTPEQTMEPSTLTQAFVVFMNILMERIPLVGIPLLRVIQTVRALVIPGRPVNYRAMGLPDFGAFPFSLKTEFRSLLVSATVSWIAYQVALDVLFNLGMMVLNPFWLIPIADQNFFDLDQIAGFVVSGLLVLIFSILGAVAENSRRAGKWLRETREHIANKAQNRRAKRNPAWNL